MSPPAKFFEPTFLQALLAALDPQAGLVCMNTLIADDKVRKQLFSHFKGVKDCLKYASKMEEDKNEMVFLARGHTDKKLVDKLELGMNRTEKIAQVANSLKLPKGVLFADPQVMHHVNNMI